MISISEALLNFSPRDLLLALVEGSYYDYLFPFLLIFAVFYTVLTSERIHLFRNSEILNKAGAFIVAFGVSIFSVYFETSPGMTVGKLMMMMFPSISTVTILTLTLYIVGQLFGKDIFRGFFDKEHSAWAYYAVGAMGLGYVVYYLGIAFGMWDFRPQDSLNQWNVILGVAMLILGIVFILIKMLSWGLILLFVLGMFVSNGGQGFILEYFVDPVIFMFVIIIFLMSWLGTSTDRKTELGRVLRDQKLTHDKYHKVYEGEPPEYSSRIYDANSKNFDKNKKIWDKEFPNENWEK